MTFEVGTKVVIRTASSWGDPSYSAAITVAKVYKSGNLVLEGSTQQWKPRSTFGELVAWPTGADMWDRRAVILLNDKTRAEIAEVRARSKRADRLHKIVKRVERMKPDEITEAALDAIEAALGGQGA